MYEEKGIPRTEAEGALTFRDVINDEEPARMNEKEDLLRHKESQERVDSSIPREDSVSRSREDSIVLRAVNLSSKIRTEN